MNNNVENRTKEILSNIFNTSVDQISEDSSPDVIRDWDSLSHVKMIVALEREFDIEFKSSEVISMVSLKKITETIRAYL